MQLGLVFVLEYSMEMESILGARTSPANAGLPAARPTITWDLRSGTYVVGAGMDVRRSNCPGKSGNGVFSTVYIPKGTAATIYDGWLLVKGSLPPASAAMTDIAHHWVCNVPGTEFQVQGFSSPLEGRGAGSFANHSSEGQNCKFAVTFAPIGHSYFGDAAATPGGKPTLVLVTTENIEPGEELLVKYSKPTLKRMGLTSLMIKKEGEVSPFLVRFSLVF